MIGSTNRATRRSKVVRRAQTAAVAATAAAAMAMGLGAAPAADAAIPVTIDIDPVYTAGTLAGLLDFVSNVFPGTDLGGILNTGPPPSVSVSIETVFATYQLLIDANLSLDYIQPGATDYLYNTLAAIPQPTCGSSYASNCRYAMMLGTSGATLNLANAYRTQISSVQDGVTPAGYIPFAAAPNSSSSKPTQTNQVLGFLQNPLRPNGGFLARFPGFAEFLGVDPSMPAAGKYTSADGRIVVNSTTLDATWAYDPTGDFPEVFRLVSILNSLSAALPLNLLGGLSGFVLADSTGKEASATDVGLNLAGLFQVSVPGTPIGTITLPMVDGVGYYATLVPNQLPIFNGLRLPSFLLNAALGALNAPFRFGTPLSDALEPATRILVNIGYDDVVTPEMIASDPATYGSYQPYDRTFLNSAVPTPFGSVAPLTPSERRAVWGDVWEALIGGFQAQFAKPFWGILEPADSAEPAAAVTPAAAQAPRAVADAAAKAIAGQEDLPAQQIAELGSAGSSAAPLKAELESAAAPGYGAPPDSAPQPATAPDPAPESDRAPTVSAVSVPGVDTATAGRDSVRGPRGSATSRVGAGSRSASADPGNADSKPASTPSRQRVAR
jgi:hypothetical protein